MIEKPYPNRQSIRLKGWDYSSPGWYFVTVDTHAARPLFGVVVNGRMVHSEAGRIAVEEWRKSAEIRTSIAFDEFVVMPNHMHGLVRLQGRLQGLDASSPCSGRAAAPPPQFGKPVAGTLGVFVGAYKAAVTRAIHRAGLMHPGLMHQAPSIWHRNYWDVVVRDEQALANIRRYIRNNPQNYTVVMQCGEPQCLGNRALLDLPKLGFLASRGEAGLHGQLPLKSGEAIISGFLSPMERTVFRAALAARRPLIWVKPWGLEDDESPAVQAALHAGTLLMLSPFAGQEAPSVRRAAWCNAYVMHYCERLVLGHLASGGMLECLLTDAPPDLEVIAMRVQ